jgi:hypothetical protein
MERHFSVSILCTVILFAGLVANTQIVIAIGLRLSMLLLLAQLVHRLLTCLQLTLPEVSESTLKVYH